MAIRTALTLTEDQLQRMTRFCRSYVEAIESSRTQWIEEREEWERSGKGDFSTRSQISNGVFAKSNETMNLVGSGIDWINARLEEDLFGSKPWFAVDPENRSGTDPLLADQVQRHLGWKLGQRQVDFPEKGSEIIRTACVIGESVTKISYEAKDDVFERIASILHRDGEPVVNENGELIFEENGTEVGQQPDGTPYVYPRGEPEMVLGVAGEEGGVQIAPGMEWREQVVTERTVTYSGAKVMPLHFKEFYCPLEKASIHDSPFVGHMTSMRLSQLKVQFGLAGGEKEEEGNQYLREVVEKLQGETTKAKSEGEKPTCLEGELPDLHDGDPVFRLFEGYFEFDARETGRPQRIFFMVAYDYDLPLFWDYIANVTPNGRYPFEVTSLIRETGRWYGVSWFQKYARFQTIIDKFLNQIIYRNELAANPAKFRRKEAVAQWQDDQPMEIGPDVVFDLNEGYSAHDALSTVELPKLDQETRFLLETVIANWRTRSGVSTATQGSFGDMPAERTATGIQQITASGNTMFVPLALQAKRGVEAVLQQVVNFQYAFQDHAETYTYLEGDAQMVAELNPRTIRGLKFNARITLTNLRQSESIQKNQMAIGFFDRFLAIPTPFQPVAAPLYNSVYKALGIDNTQDYFDRISQMNQQLIPQQQANETGTLEPGGGTLGETHDSQQDPTASEGVARSEDGGSVGTPY